MNGPHLGVNIEWQRQQQQRGEDDEDETSVNPYALEFHLVSDTWDKPLTDWLACARVKYSLQSLITNQDNLWFRSNLAFICGKGACSISVSNVWYFFLLIYVLTGLSWKSKTNKTFCFLTCVRSQHIVPVKKKKSHIKIKQTVSSWLMFYADWLPLFCPIKVCWNKYNYQLLCGNNICLAFVAVKLY